MNDNTSQASPTITDSQKLLFDIFEREPFLLEEMTPEEFEHFVLLNNNEIPIDNVDFNPPRITV